MRQVNRNPNLDSDPVRRDLTLLRLDGPVRVEVVLRVIP